MSSDERKEKADALNEAVVKLVQEHTRDTGLIVRLGIAPIVTNETETHVGFSYQCAHEIIGTLDGQVMQ